MSDLQLGSSVLSRRHLLQLAGGAGLALLAGCRRGGPVPRLVSAAETLPKAWRLTLPSPWTFSPLDPEERDPFWTAVTRNQADLIALTDGWLQACPTDQLQPVMAGGLPGQLDATASQFLELLGPQRAERVLPVGVSPWVMLFRNGMSWRAAAEQGWDVLLEPSLRGRVVLPASPRLVMDLSSHMEADDALPRLRQQLLTLDDRQGLNWLLKDRARVVVVPLQRCMQLLRRDPRITAVIPASGAPLHWTLLVRPVGTREPLPRAWVESAWTSPLRGRLLAMGWRPAVQDLVDEASELLLPRRWQELLLPSAQVWSRCWSLPPLSPQEQGRLSERWAASTP